jgi:hypothetical protein
VQSNVAGPTHPAQISANPTTTQTGQHPAIAATDLCACCTEPGAVPREELNFDPLCGRCHEFLTICREGAKRAGITLREYIQRLIAYRNQPGVCIQSEAGCGCAICGQPCECLEPGSESVAR